MQTAITLNDMELAVLKNSLLVVQIAMEKSQTTVDGQICVAKLLKKLSDHDQMQNPVIENHVCLNG